MMNTKLFDNKPTIENLIISIISGLITGFTSYFIYIYI